MFRKLQRQRFTYVDKQVAYLYVCILTTICGVTGCSSYLVLFSCLVNQENIGRWTMHLDSLYISTYLNIWVKQIQHNVNYEFILLVLRRNSAVVI